MTIVATSDGTSNFVTTADLMGLADGDVLTATATTIVVDTDPGPVVTFTASGVTYSQSTGTPISGTVTAIKIQNKGSSAFTTISGFSVSAVTLWNYVETANAAAYNALLFGDSDTLTGSASNDRLFGGAGNDTFNLGSGGNDAVNGGPGADTFNMGASLTATDSIVGGGDDTLGGAPDQMVLQGNYASGVTFTATTMTGVHVLRLNGATSGADSTNVYNLTFNAATLGAGELMNIVATNLSSTNSVNVNASAVQGGITFRGGTGSNTFTGGAGNDVFRPSLGGSMVFNGGGGTNRVSFFNAGTSSGVTVDLYVIGAAQNTGLNTATLTNVQDISGTRFNDNITGNEQNNSLESAGGSDIIFAGGGNDQVEIANGGQANTSSQVDGGMGTDLLSFWLNSQGIGAATFDLSNTGAQVTGNGTVTAVNFENLQGTEFGDHLTGDSGNNILYGAEGDDVLSGGGGNDTLYGDKVMLWQTLIQTQYNTSPYLADATVGNDTLNGGDGNDTLVSGGGNDTLDGGTGADTFLMGATLTAADTIIGGGDDVPNGIADQVILQGNYASGVTFSATTMTGIHVLRLTGATSGADSTNVYNLTFNAATLGAGELMNVVATNLSSTNSVNVNAAAVLGGITFRGGTGSNTFTGGAGNDVFRPSLGGSMVFDGGGGTNRVSFFNAGTSSGVTVDLRIVGTAQNTGLNTATLTNVQDISGTQFNDNITGNDQNNSLESAGGNDIISAGGGNDQVEIASSSQSGTSSQADGGIGTDLLSFWLNSQGVPSGATFDLSNTTAQATGQGTVTAVNFENLQGTQYADHLTGDATNNVLFGAEGDDVLSGGGGNDTLYGDKVMLWQTLIQAQYNTAPYLADATPGNDTLNGGDGDDILVGGGGNDTLDGGTGIDTAIFSGARSGYTITRNGSAISVSGTDGSDTLYNIEKLQFADQTVALAHAAGNFDGDSHSDVLFQNDSGQAATWLMDGTTVTSIAYAGGNSGPDWKLVGTGDFNADGKSDLLFQNINGQVAVWLMDGATPLSISYVGGNPGTAWKAVTTGDFDGDGKSDILLENSGSGLVAIWKMDGVGITNVTSISSAGFHVVSTGDFNADGKSDILYQAANGQVAAWIMNGLSVQSAGYIGGNPGAEWVAIGTGDLDGDGKSEVVFQNTNGQVAGWVVNGTDLVSGAYINGNPGTDWVVKGTGDLDGDGKADLLFQNISGQGAAWLMNGFVPLTTSTFGPNPGTTWHIIAGTG